MEKVTVNLYSIDELSGANFEAAIKQVREALSDDFCIDLARQDGYKFFIDGKLFEN